MTFSVTLTEWENDLMLPVPVQVARQLGLVAGSVLTVTVKSGKLIATPNGRRSKLDELCRRINASNRHKPADWGAAVGREAW